MDPCQWVYGTVSNSFTAKRWLRKIAGAGNYRHMVNFRTARVFSGWSVMVIGALVLLILFLLITPQAMDSISSLADNARRNFAGQQPFSDLILMVVFAAAAGCAILMLFWPSFERPRKLLVSRRYFGHSDGSFEPAPSPAVAMRRLSFRRLIYLFLSNW